MATKRAPLVVVAVALIAVLATATVNALDEDGPVPSLMGFMSIDSDPPPDGGHTRLVLTSDKVDQSATVSANGAFVFRDVDPGERSADLTPSGRYGRH